MAAWLLELPAHCGSSSHSSYTGIPSAKPASLTAMSLLGPSVVMTGAFTGNGHCHRIQASASCAGVTLLEPARAIPDRDSDGSSLRLISSPTYHYSQHRGRLPPCGARQKIGSRRRRRGETPSESATTERDDSGGEEEIFSLAKGWSKEYQDLGAEVNALLSTRGEASAPAKAVLQPGSEQETRAGNGTGTGKAQVIDAATRKANAARQVQSVAAGPRTTHRMLKVMAGELRGKRLLSPADRNVRPMMEMVRGAVFNMIQALAGSPAFLPGGRWLDLYSGTGSVGIEALSRGCEMAHFVEMDPWVVSSVLSLNLAECNYMSQSLIHTMSVESFLDRVEKTEARHVGGAFDYISVTPPYELVVYADLMEQLSRSPLLSETTCMVVEYPLLSRHELPDVCGPLAKIRDRKYGRTNVAVYGPQWALDD